MGVKDECERTVYLVRHCRPEIDDGVRICLGRKDIPLSSIGVEQARELARYFSDMNISGVYSSPLKRTKETADIISNSFKNKIKVVTKNDFAELDIGKWDGLTFDEIKERYPKEYEDRGNNLEDYVVDGGESMAMCRNRAIKELFNTIGESHGDIVIISHAGVLRCILSSLLEISIKESFNYKLKYGSTTILKYNGSILTPTEIGITYYKEC